MARGLFWNWLFWDWLFWGWLYLRFRSPVLNIVSHTLWDLAVFVVFPF